jgi:hypothetical protein
LIIHQITELLVAECKAGYWFSVDDNNSCQKCPVGSISADGAKSCTLCVPGTREVNRLSCKDCRPGKYSDGSVDKCLPCGVGKVSQAKAAACTVCKAGEYASHSDNKCKICPKNTISSGLADSCTPCAAGSYSAPGKSQCYVAVPGQYLDPVLLVVDCTPSFYSTNPNMQCRKCPPGKYSGPKASSCLQCAKGLFVNPAQTGCEAIRTSPAPSFAPTRAYCPGQQEYSDTLKKCIDCKAGWGRWISSLRCLRCPPNWYSTAPGKECIRCYPSDKVTNAEGTKCELCPPSFFPRHYLVGNSSLWNTRRDECVKCPAQTYSFPSINNATYRYDSTCKECPSGSRVNAAQTGCETAPPTDYLDPSKCVPGQEYDVITKKCVPCQPGFEKQFSFQRSCTPCPFGYYAPGLGNAKCYLCEEEDNYVVTPNREFCESCKPSFYKQIYPLGDYPYTNSKSAECLKCPKGTYSLGNTRCLNCPEGIEVNDEQTGCGKPSPPPTRRPTLSDADFVPCVPGQQFDRVNKVCIDCEPGNAPYYIHECHPCRAGTYAPNKKSATCTKCPIPKVVKYRISCEYCPPSFYYKGYPDQQQYPTEKEATCLKCAPGTYSGFEDSGCHTCPAGQVVNPDQTGCI